MRTIELQREPLSPALADLWYAGPRPRAVAWVLDGQVLRDPAVREAWPAGVAAVGVHGTANRDAEYAHAVDAAENTRRPDRVIANPRGWDHARALCDAARGLDLREIGVTADTPRLAVGASLGGLQALCAAIVAPELWASVVALSPSVGWARWQDDITRRWIDRVGDRCALYIDAGGATAADDNRWAVEMFGDRLTCSALRRWLERTFPGEPHAWSAWSKRVAPAIEWALRAAA